jgi:hypothetical protein
MKPWRHALIALALCYPAESWAKAQTAGDIFPICGKFQDGAGRTYTVDPQSRTLGSLPNIPAALKIARPGDTISLMSGDYGDLTLTGINQGGFLALAAANGQNPRFTGIFVGTPQDRASHWRLTGLTVSGFRKAQKSPNGAIIHPGIVAIGNSDNIIFENNIVNSRPGSITWKSEADAFAADESLSGGVSVNGASCVSLIGNHISNVFNAIMFGGDSSTDNGKYYVVNDNVIDDFAGDGIDHFASHVRIARNRITNGHDICESKCVHMDGIQGWNWNNRPGLLNVDVVIDSNQIIAQTRQDLAMPAGTLQGITVFDGHWDGFQVINNLVVATAWHGITIAGAKNLSIVNNTLACSSQEPRRTSWIKFAAYKNDPPDAPYNVVIRNNVTPFQGTDRRDMAYPNVAIDHNLVLKTAGDFEDNFVKFDPMNFAYNLHPTKKSDAKGQGSAEGTPAIDIVSAPRKAPIDIGAYAYKGD